MEGGEAIKPAGKFMADVNVVDVLGVACCFRTHFSKGKLGQDLEKTK